MLGRIRTSCVLAVSIAFGAALLTSACGQKGPLYMPDQAEKEKKEEEKQKKTTGTGY